MATAKPVTDGQECVSLWRAGLLVYLSVGDKKYVSLPDYNSACIEYGYTGDEWAKHFGNIRDTWGDAYYVLVEDDNEE